MFFQVHFLSQKADYPPVKPVSGYSTYISWLFSLLLASFNQSCTSAGLSSTALSRSWTSLSLPVWKYLWPSPSSALSAPGGMWGLVNWNTENKTCLYLTNWMKLKYTSKHTQIIFYIRMFHGTFVCCPLKVNTLNCDRQTDEWTDRWWSSNHYTSSYLWWWHN